jgi:hypothetical protein
VFERIVRPKHADLTFPKRPAFEVGGDPSAVQIDRLVNGSCLEDLECSGLVIERATALRNNQRNSAFGR